jgi:prepilin-type N-terminal cleavage/methylation domain-containing protein
LRKLSKIDRQQGFTLIELMIAMTLTTILVAMALQITVIVLDGYRVHREAVGVQRAARGSLDLIADSVRNASAGVPSGNEIDAAGCTAVSVIEVVDHDDEPDELYVMSAAGGVVTTVRADFTEADTQVTVLDGSGLAAGDMILVTDFDKGHMMRVLSTTDGGSTWTLDLDSFCSGVTFHYPRGAMVLRAKLNHFYVGDVDGVPTMFLDDDSDGPDVAEPLAEGVEDFQVAVGVDEDDDGGITDSANTSDEWHYNAAGDDDPPALITMPWRALRLTVVARTIKEDEHSDWSARPAAENHDAGSDDGFRRRKVSTIVEVRNLDGSP